MLKEQLLVDAPSQPATNEAGLTKSISRVPVAYVIGMLFLVNTFNFIDRRIPFILAEALKQDLQLSDTQFGLMGGAAFAIVYSVLGLPLGRLADRWSAKWVLTASLSFWSVLTAAGGLAQNFYQLAASRVGVAAGEGGCTPAAHAMISNLVPEHRRAMAMGVFTYGVAAGGAIGTAAGGILLDAIGWRMTMVSVGLPGLLLALLFALTIPDVRSPTSAEPATSTMFGAIRELMAKRSYRHLYFGVTVLGIAMYAFYAFEAAFVLRTYGLSASQAGVLLGSLGFATGVIATIGGGWLSDKVGRLSPGRVMLLPGIAFIVSAPLHVASMLAPNITVFLAFNIPAGLAGMFYVPPTFATAQRLASPATRGMASAALLFGLTLFGATLGPLITGMISDHLHPQLGNDSLRYALIGMSVFFLWAGIHFCIAARNVDKDLAAARAT